MYIYIFEDGVVKCYTEISDGDLDACDDGLLTIIDISKSGEIPKTYIDGEWVDVDNELNEND
jgi:hypothetical protein